MVKKRSIRTHDAAVLNHVCEQIITCMKQLDSINENTITHISTDFANEMKQKKVRWTKPRRRESAERRDSRHGTNIMDYDEDEDASRTLKRLQWNENC